MKFPVVLSTILAVSQALIYSELANELDWESYKAQYKKQYANISDDQHHMRNFMDNKMKIAKHNEKFKSGEVSFTMALNEFGDLSHPEFLKAMIDPIPDDYEYEVYIYYIAGIDIEGKEYIKSGLPQLPSAVDWRERGIVSSVKMQGYCGSCWAFSATGAIEAQYLKNGQNVSLSEQNLIDCAKDYGTGGCKGGSRDQAFKYIIANGGINSEESYPYEATDGACRYNASNIAATIYGFVIIQEDDQRALKDALATVGPVGVTIDASPESLQFYSSGIYHDIACKKISGDLNHEVLAVGYGAENDDDYWIIKNSWGETWGEAGYLKISTRDKSCGIAVAPSYPVITSRYQGKIHLEMILIPICTIVLIKF